MFVTFSSPATSDLVMFSDVARRLLALLGKEPTARGVITPSEYPAALDRLAGIPASPEDSAPAESGSAAETGDEPHARVGLHVRASPFIQMIRQAATEQVPILWHCPADFYTDASKPAA